jgi:hypothetical protein
MDKDLLARLSDEQIDQVLQHMNALQSESSDAQLLKRICAQAKEANTLRLQSQRVPEWIAVTDRLPGLQQMVLLHSPESQRAAVQYGFYGFTHNSRPGERDWFVQVSIGWEPVTNTGKPVTHWQPLPAAPEPLPHPAKEEK